MASREKGETPPGNPKAKSARTAGVLLWIYALLWLWFNVGDEYSAYTSGKEEDVLLAPLLCLILLIALLGCAISLWRRQFSALCRYGLLAILVYASFALYHPWLNVKMQAWAFAFSADPELCPYSLGDGRRPGICFQYLINGGVDGVETIVYDPTDSMSASRKNWPTPIKNLFLNPDIQPTPGDDCAYGRSQHLIAHFYWVEATC